MDEHTHKPGFAFPVVSATRPVTRFAPA